MLAVYLYSVATKCYALCVCVQPAVGRQLNEVDSLLFSYYIFVKTVNTRRGRSRGGLISTYVGEGPVP